MSAESLHSYIDEPAADATVPRGMVRVSGWVFDEEGLLEAALLLVNDALTTPVRLGGLRADVGEAFPGIPHAAASAFEGAVDLRALDAGEARIALLVRRGEGSWVEAGAVQIKTAEPQRERSGARARAAFTIVQDESVMLPLWLDYYGRHFDPEDLYVLDHGSSDGSTANLEGRCHVIPVHREAAFDHHWLRSTVELFQGFLLNSYDTVLFAEVDEFVIADPRSYSGLEDYIHRLARPASRCLGFNVIHQPDEPALRFDAPPLLAQRRNWHVSLMYSKRLLSKIQLRWSDGFHEEHKAPDDAPDPELMLVHLQRIDYDACFARRQASAARDWNEADILHERGAQNRIVEPSEFEHWFRSADVEAPRELIPEHIRSLL